jgi:phosphoribosylformylglycinamidine synthase
MNRIKPTLLPLQLDPKLTVREALERVLRLPSVASKRYLTNKVSFIVLKISRTTEYFNKIQNK